MNFNWRDIYKRAYDWVIIHGPGILLAVVVFLIGIWLIRVFNRMIKKNLEHRKVNPSVRYFLQNLISLVLQLLLIVLALQIAGFELTLFSAIIAGLTVAIGLALSGTLQNFVSGIIILFLKPYRVGDNILTQNEEGTVTSIQLFYTVVLAYDNRTLIIPNGQLSNSVIVNLTRERVRRIDISIKLSYSVDIDIAKEVLLKKLITSSLVLKDPMPRLGVSLLDYDRYTLDINCWTTSHGFIDTRLQINELVIHTLKDAGILLPGMTANS